MVPCFSVTSLLVVVPDSSQQPLRAVQDAIWGVGFPSSVGALPPSRLPRAVKLDTDGEAQWGRAFSHLLQILLLVAPARILWFLLRIYGFRDDGVCLAGNSDFTPQPDRLPQLLCGGGSEQVSWSRSQHCTWLTACRVLEAMQSLPQALPGARQAREVHKVMGHPEVPGCEGGPRAGPPRELGADGEGPLWGQGHKASVPQTCP